MEFLIKKWEKQGSRDLRRFYIHGIEGNWYIFMRSPFAEPSSADEPPRPGACEAAAKWPHGEAAEDKKFISDFFLSLVESFTGEKLTHFEDIWEVMPNCAEVEI